MTATPPIPGNTHTVRTSRCGLMSLVLLTVALSGCNLIPSMAAREHRIDPEEEARLNAIAFQEIIATHPLSQDTASIQLVQETGQRLASASGRNDVQWDFKLIQDDSPRAISLPGGRVVVSDSTLGVCQNEAQLAAVIAGAMGRQLAKHSSRQQEYKSSHALVDEPANISPRQSRPSVEADSIALSILVAAGYDPEAAQQMWFGSPVAAGDTTSNSETAQSRTTRQGSFQLALDRARFIYRSHPLPLGAGNPIAWSPRPGQLSAPAPANQEIWTAAINRGAAKPTSWNADLNSEPAPLTTVAAREHSSSGANQESDEFLPPTSGNAVQPAVYEWSSADATLVPRPAHAESEIEVVQPASFETPNASSTPASLPGPMLP